jgi:hypothetical protein
MRFLSKTKTDYDLNDFAVASSISLFKRDFYITSCDQFTRTFYANRLGVHMAPDVAAAQSHQARALPDVPVGSLVPKAPRKTYEQLRRETDYAGVKVCTVSHAHAAAMPGNLTNPPPPPPLSLSYLQLRFRAAFNHPESDDQALRRFIVTVEPKDDNITIFEEANPAAGTVQPTGGKFLEKTRIPLPGGQGNLGAKHFHVGGTFVASAREFRILECDAFTEAFMKSM